LRKKNAELVSASLRLNEVLKQVRDDEEIFAYFVSIIPFDRAFKRFYNSGVLCLPLSDLPFAGDRFFCGRRLRWLVCGDYINFPVRR
jgi:hypothetical protein